MQTTALIVGAGPVGLTAAIELKRYGVRVRIVDRQPERSEKSKALAIWARTLELMDRAGVGGALVTAGLKATGTRMFSGKRQIGEVSFDHLASAHRYVLLIPQNTTERVLTDHLTSLGVTVERGVELSSFDDNDDGVGATLRHPDGSVETLEASWLVACDGAHSPTRHMLQKSFDGTTVSTDFILADVHLTGDDVSRSQISMFAHVDGLLQLFPIVDDRYRVIADLGDATGAQRPDPTLEEVQAIIDERGPGGITAHAPLWLSRFRINERQVEDYRSGHVFLAGDAAHVHSPAGGQGMNTGMQDACNLAWKIALVSESTCSSELLETYSAERRPVAHRMIAETSRLSAVMTMKNPVLQTVRNHAIGLLLGFPSVGDALAETLSEIAIGYPDSSLTRNRATWNAKPQAGARAPHVAGETRDGAGEPRYTLHAENDERTRRFVQEHRALVALDIRPPFAPRAMWLVRPDGYVGIVADAGDIEAMNRYLAIVAGRLAKTTL